MRSTQACVIENLGQDASQGRFGQQIASRQIIPQARACLPRSSRAVALLAQLRIAVRPHGEALTVLHRACRCPGDGSSTGCTVHRIRLIACLFRRMTGFPARIRFLGCQCSLYVPVCILRRRVRMRHVRAKIVAIQSGRTGGPECRSGSARVSRQGDAIDAATYGVAGLLVPAWFHPTLIVRP